MTNTSVMLENKDIVVLGLTRSDAHVIAAGFKISTELARKNRVLYIDHPYNLLDIIKERKTTGVKRRIKWFFPFVSGLEPKICDGASMTILHLPAVFPTNALPVGGFYNLFSKINHIMIGLRVKRAMKKLGMIKPIYINCFDFYYPEVVNWVRPSLSVYFCVDQITKDYSAKHGLRLEKEIMVSSDLVINTSDALFDRNLPFNRNCEVVHNAADYDHFKMAQEDSLPLHSSMTGLKHPVIGYYGLVERRSDFNVLINVFKKRNDWTLLLAGPVQWQWVPDELKKMPNVVFTGKWPYSELPSILKGFDVAIIPYKRDGVSETIFPLKLYEYLGGGKPVVSLNFSPSVLNRVKDVVYIAEDALEFEKKIELALNEDSQVLIEKRMNIAAENTWANRGERFGNILYKYLVD